MFYCHGCGAGGDVFAFVQLLLPCGFRDSVAFLAGLAGIDLKAFTPTAELRERIEKQKARKRERDSFEEFADFWIGAVCRSIAPWPGLRLTRGLLTRWDHPQSR